MLLIPETDRGSLFPKRHRNRRQHQPAAAGQGASGWSHGRRHSVVFCATAHYALVDLAAARSGQRVLIHHRHRRGGHDGGAAGSASGVRCSRPQQGKWDTLRTMEADDDHISNSRSLEFETGFRAAAAVEVRRGSRTRWPVNSWMRRCVWHRVGVFLGDGQDRHPRPRRDHARACYRAFGLSKRDRTALLRRSLPSSPRCWR